MAIVLYPQETYWIDPLQQTFARGLLSGLQSAMQAAMRKDLLRFQDELERQREQERLEQIGLLSEQMAQALEEIPSPERTYIFDRPSFRLEEPELELSAYRQKYRPQGLLGVNVELGMREPETARIESVLKEPAEYQAQVYTQTLPIMTKLTSLGVNVSSLPQALIQQQAKAYQQREAEARRQKKLTQKTAVARSAIAKLFPDVDQETADYLGLAVATGQISIKDIKSFRKRNAVFDHVKLDDGRVVIYAGDKDTGAMLWEKEIRPDLSLMEKKAQVKAKQKQTAPRLQVVTVEIPSEEYERLARTNPSAAIMLQMQGRDKQKIRLLFDKDTRTFYTPVKKLPVDPNDPEDLRRKLAEDRGENVKQRSVFDLFGGDLWQR